MTNHSFPISVTNEVGSEMILTPLQVDDKMGLLVA